MTQGSEVQSLPSPLDRGDMVYRTIRSAIHRPRAEEQDFSIGDNMVRPSPFIIEMGLIVDRFHELKWVSLAEFGFYYVEYIILSVT